MYALCIYWQEVRKQWMVAMTMTAKLVKMGNSRGVRLPKSFLQQAGLEDNVELRVENKSVVITPAALPRAGWAEAISQDAAGDDEFLWAGYDDVDDLDWWTWPEQNDATKP